MLPKALQKGFQASGAACAALLEVVQSRDGNLTNSQRQSLYENAVRGSLELLGSLFSASFEAFSMRFQAVKPRFKPRFGQILHVLERFSRGFQWLDL